MPPSSWACAASTTSASTTQSRRAGRPCSPARPIRSSARRRSARATSRRSTTRRRSSRQERTGKGVNLVIVGETFYKKADIASFQSHFGITTSVEQDVLVPNTGTSKVNDSGDEGETELDLEWSSAAAPGANIIFVYTGNDRNFGVDDSVAYAVEEGAHLVPGTGNGAAQIISESYGGCDADYVGSDADIDSEIAAAANLEGITNVAASGDDGAAGCIEDGIGGLYVGPPSDLPGVTGVGGTEFCGNGFGCTYAGAPGVDVQKAPYFNASNVAVEYPAVSGVSLEGVWNDSDLPSQYISGGGGGSSIIFPKPFYQVGVAGMPNDGARDVPDVSLTASPNNVGYLTWEENQLADGGEADTLGATGGTSAATPSFAGILALVNQAVAANGGQLGLGNVNPQLYALFANNGASGAFHDIVVGDNDYVCDPTTRRTTRAVRRPTRACSTAASLRARTAATARRPATTAPRASARSTAPSSSRPGSASRRPGRRSRRPTRSRSASPRTSRRR